MTNKERQLWSGSTLSHPWLSWHFFSDGTYLVVEKGTYVLDKIHAGCSGNV
jgi:hypothetical protein